MNFDEKTIPSGDCLSVVIFSIRILFYIFIFYAAMSNFLQSEWYVSYTK